MVIKLLQLPSILTPIVLSVFATFSATQVHAAPKVIPTVQAKATSKSRSIPAVSNPLDTSAANQDFGSLPTNITSDTLVLHSTDRVFIYKGHVVVVQGDMTLNCDQLEGTYDELNQIKKLLARGNVKITKQDIVATSQQALYETATATVTLIDNPQLKQKESILTADKIKVFMNDNRSQAEGNVRVTMVKKDGEGLSFDVNKPTPGPTAIITPKFSTVNAPTPREVVVPTPTVKAAESSPSE